MNYKQRYDELRKKPFGKLTKEEHEEKYELYFRIFPHCPRCASTRIAVTNEYFPYQPRSEAFECIKCRYKSSASELLDAITAQTIERPNDE